MVSYADSTFTLAHAQYVLDKQSMRSPDTGGAAHAHRGSNTFASGIRHSGHSSRRVTTASLIAAIGLSRIYLGVHFLSDVIGGCAAAAVWMTACTTGVELSLRQPRLAPSDVGVDP